ncbi:MAG: hypothetical protein ACP5UV_01270 [Thermoplasmata archaeon]
MLQKVSTEEKINNKNDLIYKSGDFLNILFPTRCRNNTIEEIQEFLNLLTGKINVDFLNVVPDTQDYFCIHADVSDVLYSRAIAERELYSFIKKFPKAENMTYNYKVADKNLKDAILNSLDGGDYDIIAMEISEFCHCSSLIFEVSEIISSVKIPVIMFKGGQVNNKRDGEKKTTMEGVK